MQISDIPSPFTLSEVFQNFLISQEGIKRGGYVCWKDAGLQKIGAHSLASQRVVLVAAE